MRARGSLGSCLSVVCCVVARCYCVFVPAFPESLQKVCTGIFPNALLLPTMLSTYPNTKLITNSKTPRQDLDNGVGLGDCLMQLHTLSKQANNKLQIINLRQRKMTGMIVTVATCAARLLLAVACIMLYRMTFSAASTWLMLRLGRRGADSVEEGSAST